MQFLSEGSFQLYADMNIINFELALLEDSTLFLISGFQINFSGYNVKY